jgi:hypothetical protein
MMSFLSMVSPLTRLAVGALLLLFVHPLSS